MDFYLKYRPRKFSEVMGPSGKLLADYIKNGTAPQSVMFVGPSGVGKTTLARLLAAHINCTGRPDDEVEPCGQCSNCVCIMQGKDSDGVREINAADERGISVIRDVISLADYSTLSGAKRVFIFDEVHQLTNTSQQALLKILEDKKPDTYLILCTTETKKLINTLVSRCTKFSLSSLNQPELLSFLRGISAKESRELDERIYNLIYKKSEGNIRTALVYLQQVINSGLDDVEQIDKFLGYGSVDLNISELCKCLQTGTWGSVEGIFINLINNFSPESILAILLNYFGSCLLRTKDDRRRAIFAEVVEVLHMNLSDYSAKVSLVLMIHKIFTIFHGGGDGRY